MKVREINADCVFKKKKKKEKFTGLN